MLHAGKHNRLIPASFVSFWRTHPDAQQGVPVNVAYKCERYHMEHRVGILLDTLDLDEQAYLQFDPTI